MALLIMLGEHIKTRALINNVRFKGAILPIANGSMAIEGEGSDEVDKQEQQLK